MRYPLRSAPEGYMLSPAHPSFLALIPTRLVGQACFLQRMSYYRQENLILYIVCNAIKLAGLGYEGCTPPDIGSRTLRTPLLLLIPEHGKQHAGARSLLQRHSNHGPFTFSWSFSFI